MQYQVQSNPLKGFWLVSAAAFLVAPFLTNDGVCLLFVELILDAFEATKSLSSTTGMVAPSSPKEREKIAHSKDMPLETGDAIYFLLTLACSANIGSALTYTGNSVILLLSIIRIYISGLLLLSPLSPMYRKPSKHDSCAGCSWCLTTTKILRHYVSTLDNILANE